VLHGASLRFEFRRAVGAIQSRVNDSRPLFPEADAPPVRAIVGAADRGIFSTRLNFCDVSEKLDRPDVGA
jgi:hypothetical protein